jgi:hypothetical protein
MFAVHPIPNSYLKIEQQCHANDGHHRPSRLIFGGLGGGGALYEHFTHLFISFSGTVLRLVTKNKTCSV